MKDFAIILVLLIILGFSIIYIIKEKKKGVKCIGCPFAESCSKKKKIDSKCDF